MKRKVLHSQKLSFFVTLICVLFCSFLGSAQTARKYSFTTAFSSKFSIGEEVRSTILYEPGFTINYPKVSTYDNPVYCLEFGPNYDVSKLFNVGFATGIAVAQNVGNPLTSNQYFNRVMFPLSIHVGYLADLGPQVRLIPKYKVGYQFLSSQFGYTDEGFLYEQSGGLMMALGVELSRRIGDYWPSINIGYELNVIQSDVSLGWIDGYDYNDKYQFSTSYHLFNIGIGLKY
jgi:hypothetical protein